MRSSAVSNRPLITRIASIICFSCAVVFLNATPASAQSYWTGGGSGTNYKWDAGGNWLGGSRPGTGATVIFNNRNGIGTIVSPMAMKRSFDWSTITFSNINNRLPTTLDINTDDGGTTARILSLSGGINLADTMSTVRFNANNFGVLSIVMSNNNTFSTSLGSTLILNPVISGGFGLNKTGAGTLVLGGVNTYTGLTTINGGTLRYATNNAIAAGGVTVNSTSTLALNGFSDSVGQVIVDGGFITGGGTLTSTAAFDARSGLSSAILAGSVGLNKSTVGTFTMSAANTYTGQTTINAGTLAYGANNAIANGAVTVNSTGTLAINGFSDTVGQVIVDGGSITGTGGTLSSTANFDVRSGSSSANLGGTVGLNKSTTGSFTLSNTNSYTGTTNVNGGSLILGHATNTLSDSGAVVVNGGTLSIGNNNDTVASVTLVNGSLAGTGGKLSASAFNVQNGTITAGLSGVGGLTKSTAGTVTLSSASDYLGNTDINSGTFIVSSLGSINSFLSTFNSSGDLTRIDAGGVVNVNQVNLLGSTTMTVNGTLNATSGVNVGANATLKGSGQINAALTLATGAQLAPGNSIGHLTMNSLALSGTYDWEVNSTANSADLVDVTSVLDLSGASLNIIELGTYGIGKKFTLFSYGALNLSQFTGWANGTTQGGWRINYFDSAPGLNGGSGLGYVTLTSVPEPSTLFLGVLGLGGIAMRRRRRA
jgi:autotransporter-associated beta strand protein